MRQQFSGDPDAFDKLPAHAFLNLPPKPSRQSKSKRRRLRKLLSKPKRGAWWDDYHRYIASDKWKLLKLRIVTERGRICERCGTSKDSIDLHHLTYARLGRELNEDLKLYCRDCHQLMHADKKITAKAETA